jgi:hypothetical protein
MIEIKKPNVANGVQYITLYKDFVLEGVNFTTLNTVPYKILNAQGANKCIVPVNLIVDFYSTGITSGWFCLGQKGITGNDVIASMFAFWGSGVFVDNSGLLTLNISYLSSSTQINQLLNNDVYLFTQFNEGTANFTKFKIYFTYYILNVI